MGLLPAVLTGSTADGVLIANKGVKVERLVPRLVRFVVRAGLAHQALFNMALVITSGNDGEHAAGSAHFRNEAVDICSHDLSPVQQVTFLVILVQLGQDDGIAVFDERVNPQKQHWHCEVAG
jgi:hypothetical protein